MQLSLAFLLTIACISLTIASVATKTYVTMRIWRTTWEKLKRIAELTNRSVIAALDVLVTEELRALEREREREQEQRKS
jgi:hypothetical protein